MFTEKIKYFTPKEAQRTLPLVKQIVRDILANGARIRLYLQDHPFESDDCAEVTKLNREINQFMDELNEIGCYYKDWNFAIGLVDFPAIIYNKEVLLCWRSDEDCIKYYHTLEDGYQGRELIPEEYLQ